MTMLPCSSYALVVAAFMSAVAVPAAHAQEQSPDDTEVGPVFLLSLGGKLYDDFWTVLDTLPPETRNPAISAGSGITVRESWRCVTCHGWSYTGATVGGSSFPGVIALEGADPAAIKARILDPAHPFPAESIPDVALDLLTAFIRNGLHQRADYLDADGKAVGNPEFGRDIFEGACINCHQIDGRRYLKGEHGDRSSLGWVVRNRPDQALHKIMNGVPAAEMLSLRFMSVEQVSDLIAYLQALDPAEN